MFFPFVGLFFPRWPGTVSAKLYQDIPFLTQYNKKKTRSEEFWTLKHYWQQCWSTFCFYSSYVINIILPSYYGKNTTVRNFNVSKISIISIPSLQPADEQQKVHALELQPGLQDDVHAFMTVFDFLSTLVPQICKDLAHCSIQNS